MRNVFIPLGVWAAASWLSLFFVAGANITTTSAVASNSSNVLDAAASSGYSRYAAAPRYDDDQQQQQQQQQQVYPSHIIRQRHMYSYEEPKINHNEKSPFDEPSPARIAKNDNNKYYSPRDENEKSTNYDDNENQPQQINKYFSPSPPKHFSKRRLSDEKLSESQEPASLQQQQSYDDVNSKAVEDAVHQQRRPTGYEIVTTIINEDLGIKKAPQYSADKLSSFPQQQQYEAPQVSSNEVSPHNSHGNPTCAKNEHSKFCLHDYYYPAKKLQHAIAVNRNAFLKLYAEASPEDWQSESNKDDNSPYFGRLCNAHVAERAKLKRARNVQGQWQIIVQAHNYEQTVRLEQCKGYKNDCCNYVDELRYDSQCVQKNAFHRLVVYDPALYSSNKYDHPFRVDIFKLPSCCTCQIDPYSAGKALRKCGGAKQKSEEQTPAEKNPEPHVPFAPPAAAEAPPPPPQQLQHEQPEAVQPVITKSKNKNQITIDIGSAGALTEQQQQQLIQQQVQNHRREQQQQQQQQQDDQPAAEQQQELFPPGPPPDEKFASAQPPVPLTSLSEKTLPEQPAAQYDQNAAAAEQIQKRSQFPVDLYSDESDD